MSIIAALRRRRAAGFGERRRLLGADDEPSPAFHRVEHRSDDVEVFAEQIRPRRERKDAVHRRQPAELARHVVRRRRHRSERRPPHDDLDVAEPHQVGEVRVAAGELRDLGLAADVEPRHAARRQTVAQPRAEPRPIELFAGPNAPGRPVPWRKRLSCAPCASIIPTRSSSSSGGSTRSCDEHVYPNEHTYPPADRRRRPLAADRDRRGAQAEGARRRPVESVPAGERVRRRADQRRVRAALRDHGPRARVRPGGLQLLGARHRQHGSAGALRHARRSASNGSSRCWPARSARASR